MEEIVKNDLTNDLTDVSKTFNLYDCAEFSKFEDTDGGKTAIKNHKISIRNGNIAKLIVWAVLVVILLVLFNTGHPFWAIIVALLGGGAAWGFTKFSFRASADTKLQQDMSEHCAAIAEHLVNNHFKDATYFYYFTDALIYDKNMCAYFSTETGDFVIYNKSNIKDVARERVHVGTHTTSTATTTGKSQRTLAASMGLDPFGSRSHKSKTSVVTKSTEIYEWHLDVLTDFMEYPKISMVLPDEKWAEDEIAKAFGILKP
jgi:hypothetical protein